MIIEVNRQNLTGILSASVTRSLDTNCAQFVVTASSKPGIPFPFKRRDPIKIKTFNGSLLLNGFVEKISINYSSSDHIITIQGRDLLADVVDSTVSGSFEFSAPTTLNNIVRTALNNNNLEDIKIIDNAKQSINFNEGGKVSIEIGTSLMEAIESYCRLKAVMVVSDEEGNLVLYRSDQPAQIERKLIQDPDDLNSCILSSSCTYNDTGLYNTYRIYGQGNVSDIDEISIADISFRTAEATDSNIRNSRILNYQAEHSSNQNELAERNIWEINNRRSSSFKYSCEVQGHEWAEGSVYTLNSTISVKDIFANMDGIFLTKSLEFSYDISLGARTDIGLVVKDAYTLQAQQEQREARANKAGDEF